MTVALPGDAPHSLRRVLRRAERSRLGRPGGSLRGLHRPNFAAALALLPLLVLYALLTALHPARANINDEGLYLADAHVLLHGFFPESGATTIAAILWHGPALPLLLVPLVAVHLPLTIIRILVGPVLQFAAVLVFHRLVRTYLAPRAALIAAAVLGLYLPFLANLRTVAVEPLATLCFSLAVLFLLRAFRGGRRDAVWTGAAFAVLALARVEFGYVAGICLTLSAVWVIVRRGSSMARSALTAAVVSLLLCVPWLAYTYSVTHRPFEWGDAGGLSLYWMSAPGNLGDWHRIAEAFSNPALAADRRDLAAVQRLPPLAQDPRLQHIALLNIRRDPKHYLENVVNNVDRLVFNEPYSQTNQKASTMFYAVPNAALLGALIVAALAAVRRRRRLEAGLIPIAALVAVSFLVHVPLAAYARFLVPLVPAIAFLALAVIAPLWQPHDGEPAWE